MKEVMIVTSVWVNLKKLEKEDLFLDGNLAPKELDLPQDDECVQLQEPVRYALQASLKGGFVLVRGIIQFVLNCECVRCLDLFRMPVKLDFNEVLALEGGEKVEIKDDSIDLTHHIREDILLSYPQHPLCDEECDRLPQMPSRKNGKRGACAELKSSSAAWAELDKLKLD